MRVFVALFLALSSTAEAADYSTKCTAEECDTVTPYSPSEFTDSNVVISYTTSRDDPSSRLAKSSTTFSPSPNGGWQKIKVDSTTTYQTVVGFGGALTDAAAITIGTLTEDMQHKLLNSYYSEEGLEYTLGRVPIASCDFSTGVYSYDETPEDYDLSDFSIDVDSSPTTGNKLGLIKTVLGLSANPISLFASPWAPPAWMTKTNSTVGNPSLRDEPEVKQSWALYFSKFFEAYRNAGIEFWGVTVQNEPAGNTGAWQDLKMTPEEQRDFVKDYLGPQLEQTDPDVHIMMHDDQRVHLPKWTSTILDDPDASKYISGVGVHWYSEVEDYVDWATKPFDKMKDVNSKYPDKFVLATEACNGFIPYIDQGPKLGDWNRGERYAYDILNDLNAFAVGWTDWNIALDLSGGPNWAKNVVDAPILIDTEAGDVFYKNPMYYYLGHFSKFIKPGSVRIAVESTANIISAPMETTAFLTPVGEVIVVVLNRDIAGHEYNIEVEGRGFINVEVPKHSIQTFIFQK